MSKLEELIQELCPDGVRFKSIKEVYQRVKGTPITAGKMKKIENNKGDIRIFAGGKTVINAYEKDIPKANITRVPAVLVQSRGIIDVIYYEKPFTFKNEMWAYTHQEKISVKFLYYVLKNNINKFRESASGMGSMPQISLKITEDFKIPILPLPIQKEIVRILDNFTELTVELTAELTARKKQYEYYRDTLLTFNDTISRIRLEEIAKIYDGTHTTPNYTTAGVQFISVENIDKIYSSSKYISYDDYLKYKNKPVVGDLFMTRIGTIGKCAVFEKQQDLAYYVSLALIKPDPNIVNSKYLKYIIESNIGRKELYKRTLIHAVPIKINKDEIGKIKLPVPPLEEQQRIVNILDRFDKLCNNISEGLPAEIEARQKQYEYYRDKLLTFKPLEEEK